jgi:hypothetical protein
MSFLSAIGAMRPDKSIGVTLEIPDVIGTLLSAIKRLFTSVTYVVKSLTEIGALEIRENWEYQIDPTTHLRILKVEKDPMALKRTRNALRDLFQTSE